MSEHEIPDIWYLGRADDGEYTGPGDNPPGSPGDWYDIPEVIDNRTGALVCEAADVETAKQIIREHNIHADLMEACEAAYNHAVTGFPSTKARLEAEARLAGICAAAIAKAKGQ